MKLDAFKSWLTENVPEEAPKADEHVEGLSKIEKMLGMDLDDIVKGGDISGTVEKLKSLSGAASMLGGGSKSGGLLGGLMDKASSLTGGKIDFMLLLTLYQRFFKSKKS